MMKTLSRATRSLKIWALMSALMLLAAPGIARADCSTAPLGSTSDLVVSFLATNSTQVAPASLMASTVKEGTLVYDPALKVLRLCDGATWATVGEGTSSGQDPAAVTLGNLNNQYVSTLVTSNIVQITDLTIGVQVNISGDGNPAYRICSDATCTTVLADWSTDQGIIQNNQYLQLRTTTAATSNTTYTVTTRVGSDTLTWTARTHDGTAAAFDFTNVTGQTISTVVASNIVTINNPSHEPMAVSVTGSGTPQVSINGGAWGTTGTINDGQTLQVRLTSNASPLTGNTATVTVGTVSDTYTVTTATNAPSAYNFTNATNQTVSTLVTSNSITLTNTALAPMAVTVTGAGSPQISIAGGAWANSGTMNAGQTLQVRMTSNGSPLSSDNITITVAGVTSTWSVGTASGTPTYTFTDLTSQLVSTLVTSNTLTITNAAAANMAVSITGGGQVSINGGAWGTSGTLPSGGTLQLRMTSSAVPGTQQDAIVTVAGVSDTWSVTTAVELYSFTTHTFTSCGTTGQTGPTLSTCTSAYTTSWDNNTSYFNMSVQGIQLWTVPANATYRITAAGAVGATGGAAGGNAAVMRGDFTLTQGSVIKILVGQTTASYGGGGGTFVTTSSDTPLIVAGGGGGGGSSYPGNAASTSTAGTNVIYYGGSYCSPGSAGTNGGGGGGGGGGSGGGGGGLLGNGGDGASCYTSGGAGGNGTNGSHASSCAYASSGGRSFLNGGVGGASNASQPGGFGGGGGRVSYNSTGGAGGGYSGGMGSCYNDSGYQQGGGGGGSYNNGTNQVNAVTNTGAGYVTIDKL